MNRNRVIIVGGGISGLAAAYRLCELSRAQGMSLNITVLEAKDRFGGVIETETKDGFLLEGGPDAFISDKPWALDLCKRLGLENELIMTQTEMRRSFIVHRGRLAEVPEGFYLLAPARFQTLFQLPFLSWPGKLRMACEFLIPEKENGKDESVGNFVRRRFGHEALERIAQPMVGGIYTADIDRLSLQATFPRFQEMVKDHGSFIKALHATAEKKNKAIGEASGPRYSLFLSLRGGVETLVKKLMVEMPEVCFRDFARVRKIDRPDVWKIILENGEELQADVLCLALPAYGASALLSSLDSDLAGELDGIPYESAATVNLAYRREDVPHPLNGFGFVIPAIEKRKLIGCTFAHVKFQSRAP